MNARLKDPDNPDKFQIPVRLRAPRIDRDIRSLTNDLLLLLADGLPKNAAKPGRRQKTGRKINWLRQAMTSRSDYLAATPD
jgi:hypothetical protein